MKALIALILCFSFVAPAWAEISQEEAIAIAQSEGKVLSVKKKEGRYIVKVKDNGKVRFVVIDADSGEKQ